jgi:hypothetical protein
LVCQPGAVIGVVRGKNFSLSHLKETMMKKMLLAISGMTWLMTGMVFAQAETPVIDQRQANQKKRIDQEIASGQLN